MNYFSDDLALLPATSYLLLHLIWTATSESLDIINRLFVTVYFLYYYQTPGRRARTEFNLYVWYIKKSNQNKIDNIILQYIL